MSFKPQYGKFVTEDFNSSIGLTLDPDAAVDGTLRIPKTGDFLGPGQHGLPSIPASPITGELSADKAYIYHLNTHAITDDWTIDIESIGIYSGAPLPDSGMRFAVPPELSAGQMMGQTSQILSAGASNPWTNVTNATGWVVDIRTRIQSGWCKVVIQDDVYGVYIYIGKEWIRISSNDNNPWASTSMVFPVDMNTAPRTLRIAGIGTTLYAAIEGGPSGYAIMSNTGEFSVSGPELVIGIDTDYDDILDIRRAAGDLRLHDLRIYGHDIQGTGIENNNGYAPEGASLLYFPTGEHISYSEEFSPTLPISAWRYSTYAAEALSGGGTTSITPEYRINSGDAWTALSATSITATTQTQDLSSIVAAGTGEDQIRFKIAQTVVGVTGEPPRIDSISVAMTEKEPTLRMIPSWGPTRGDNTIAVDIYRGLTGEEDITTDDELVFSHGDTTLTDRSTNTHTITGTGSPVKDVDYVEVSTLAFTASPVDNTPTGYTSGTHGDVGDEFTVVGISGSDPQLAEAKVVRIEAGVSTEVNAQKVTAIGDGQGFSIPGITGLTIGNLYSLEFISRVYSGQMRLEAVGAVTSIVYDRGVARRTKVTFVPTSTTVTFSFEAANGAAVFTVGNLKLYTGTEKYLEVANDATINGTQHTFSMSVYTEAYAAQGAVLCSNLSGSNGYELRIAGNGYLELVSGTDVLTTQVIVEQRKWIHISGTIRTVSGNSEIEACVDGSFAGRVIKAGIHTASTTALSIGRGPGSTIRVFAGKIRNLRIRSIGMTAFDQSYDLSRFTLPRFQSSRESAITANTKLSLRMNRTSGIIEDDSGDRPAILPDVARTYVFRGSEGAHGTGFRFIRNDDNRFGYLEVPDLDSWSTTSDFMIDGWIKLPAQGVRQSILSLGNPFGGSHGITLRVNESDELEYGARGATQLRSTTHTSTLADSEWHYIAVEHNWSTHDIKLTIDGTTETDSGTTIGTMGSAPTTAYIGCLAATGEGLTADLDEIRIEASVGAGYGYPLTGDKWTPTEPVLVDHITLHADRVLHLSDTRKLVVMPANDRGKVPLQVGTGTLYGNTPYTYTESYNIALATGDLEAQFGSTRSPFRIVNTTPDHGVNIALISTPSITIGSNLSVTDLSGLEPSNRIGYGADEVFLYNSTTGDYSYTDSVNTREIRISNRVARYRDLTSPVPLYYKYLVGRDQYYLYAPQVASTGDIEIARGLLRVTGTDGSETDLIWDIDISSTDYNGDSLPSNVYSVVLYTSDILDDTAWVHYRGIYRLDKYSRIENRAEVINAVPLFHEGTGRLSYTTTLNSDSTYDITVVP